MPSVPARGRMESLPLSGGLEHGAASQTCVIFVVDPVGHHLVQTKGCLLETKLGSPVHSLEQCMVKKQNDDRANNSD